MITSDHAPSAGKSSHKWTEGSQYFRNAIKRDRRIGREQVRELMDEYHINL